ncbi:hypothetical protein PV728_29355 [Streptomyces europaeiscabiei]|uniref:ParB N-terminal domain-containing protein n=1 Tax=Streptomyces europaeiscabiei TaxID=146819 RepID=UPI0029B015A0|nr:ParB N-terminal domain-containing protein [Streptomyces europaeiscabiei]MDX3634298.1 hypothetical protein [Streptomyces europaeiscabiei]MDX3651854.1 hypothetical protein [Streptomyces europaeiscabiei]
MTSTYRKKPIPVRALQLTADSYRQILDTLTADQFTAGGENTDGTVFVEVRSLEGVMHASEDDWIVWDSHGHVWVVRAGIFAETYEPVYAEEASVEERIARRLAAGDYCVSGDEPDYAWWTNRPPRFRDDYLAHARQVIALVRAEDQLASDARAENRSSAELQVWPLKRILAEVRCGSRDWSWEEEWADLDHRHAETGYLDSLEQQIRQRGITVPVLIGSDGRLWDGHHRLRIAVRLGIGYVPVEIAPPGNDAEARPRCSHCQMPHDLTPGSLPMAMCESVRRRIAKAGQLHAEGDHSLCTRSDCDALRDRATQNGAQPS